ncbi:hypothetical protein [Gluconacetobacter asukensis]|uniref:hypothetical protein n=1 Tax=Gluconacetobacter asukensis TaxID=1017181 RepID=UPI0031E6C232
MLDVEPRAGDQFKSECLSGYVDWRAGRAGYAWRIAAGAWVWTATETPSDGNDDRGAR